MLFYTSIARALYEVHFKKILKLSLSKWTEVYAISALILWQMSAFFMTLYSLRHKNALHAKYKKFLEEISSVFVFRQLSSCRTKAEFFSRKLTLHPCHAQLFSLAELFLRHVRAPSVCSRAACPKNMLPIFRGLASLPLKEIRTTAHLTRWPRREKWVLAGRAAVSRKRDGAGREDESSPRTASSKLGVFAFVSFPFPSSSLFELCDLRRNHTMQWSLKSVTPWLGQRCSDERSRSWRRKRGGWCEGVTESQLSNRHRFHRPLSSVSPPRAKHFPFLPPPPLPQIVSRQRRNASRRESKTDRPTIASSFLSSPFPLLPPPLSGAVRGTIVFEYLDDEMKLLNVIVVILSGAQTPPDLPARPGELRSRYFSSRFIVCAIFGLTSAERSEGVLQLAGEARYWTLLRTLLT